jgi:hypothetical protein
MRAQKVTRKISEIFKEWKDEDNDMEDYDPRHKDAYLVKETQGGDNQNVLVISDTEAQLELEASSKC